MSKEIPIPEEAFEIIRNTESKLFQLEAQMKNYAAGLRHGLKVPSNWVLDIERKAFVPPPA